jgi:hypothetical protein
MKKLFPKIILTLKFSVKSGMRKAKTFITVFFLGAICINGFSQYKKNAVVIELFGKSFYYFDISYERYFSENFHVGAGLGNPTIDKLYYNSEMIKRYEFKIPVYLGYSIGLKKHHAMSELGITIFTNTDFHNFNNFDEPVLPYISFGYEYQDKGTIFRIPVYLAYIGRNEFFPAVGPWIGLSLGKRF